MRKYLLFVALMIVGLCLLGTPAQAAYVDAISINISTGGTGDVTAATTGAGGLLASNWINTPYNGPGIRSAAGGALAGSTSSGTALAGFTLSLYNGGWNTGVSTFIEATAGDNTPGKHGWNMGHMANTAWGWVRGDVDLAGIPAAMATAGYDVYALAGHSQTTLSWVKMTDVTPLYVVNPARINGSQSGLAGTGLIGGGQPCPADDWRVAAYQILQLAPPTGDLIIQKYWDKMGDGSIAGDPLLGGWTYNVSGVGLGITDNVSALDMDPTLGIIKLINLTAGPYTVTEVTPGWIATYDSDGAPFGTVLAQVVGGQTTTVQFGNTISEPAGLGLIGLALLAVRKRRS